MMQQALRSRLLADSPIAALVGTRIEWDRRWQGSELPAITLEMRETRDQTMDGLQATRRPSVRAHVFAKKPADAHNLVEFLIEAVVPAADQGTVRFLRSFANTLGQLPVDTDSDGQVIHQVVEFQINHTPIP